MNRLRNPLAEPTFVPPSTNGVSSHSHAPSPFDFGPPQTVLKKQVSTLRSRNLWRDYVASAYGDSPPNLLGAPVSKDDEQEHRQGDRSNTGVYSDDSRAGVGIYDQDVGPQEHPFSPHTGSTPRTSANPSSLASTNPSSLPESNNGVIVSWETSVAVPFQKIDVERVGRSPNLLWNKEAQRVMLIDFARAAVTKCGLKDRGMWNKQHAHLSSPQRLQEAFRLWIGHSSSHSSIVLISTSPAKESS